MSLAPRPKWFQAFNSDSVVVFVTSSLAAATWCEEELQYRRRVTLLPGPLECHHEQEEDT